MIKLHQAKLSDTFEVLHVLNTALDRKRSYGDNAWTIDKFTTAEVLPFVEAGELYIVLESGDVTGVVVLLSTDEDNWGKDGVDGTSLYIHKFASLQKGLGIKIIDAASLIAKKNGKAKLRLRLNDKNEALENYFAELGFKAITPENGALLLQKDV